MRGCEPGIDVSPGFELKTSKEIHGIGEAVARAADFHANGNHIFAFVYVLSYGACGIGVIEPEGGAKSIARQFGTVDVDLIFSLNGTSIHDQR